MGLFSSLEKDAKEAAEKVSAQFPGSSVTAEVHDKVVTLSGHTPDVVTKRAIMEAFSKLVPDAENVINSIHPEHAGTAPSQVPVSAGHSVPDAAGAAPGMAPTTGGAAAGPRHHVVVSGDTLGAISKHYYGKAADYMKIFEANRGILTDPDKIYPGQKLVIP